MVKVSTLKTNPGNPRQIKGDKLNLLKASVSGFQKMMELRPIIVDDENVVLGGNMRLAAIRSLGMKEVPGSWVKRAEGLTEDEKREFVIKDNAGFGEWDWDMLARDWNDLPLAEWGLDMPVVDTDNEELYEDDFELPEQVLTDIVLGDIFQIGRHRLICGDCTDTDAVSRLMDGQRADIAFTSPPYNAGTTPTESKAGIKSKYANDDDNKGETEYLKLLVDFTNNTLLFASYSFVNVQSIANNKTTLIDYLARMKPYYADTLIWNKQSAQPAMASNVLNSQFEYIHVFGDEDDEDIDANLVHVFSHKATRAIGVKRFRGGLSNVVNIPKQSQNKVKGHHATFPVLLPGHFIKNFSTSSVLDMFLGTGTSMIAAQQIGRTCYGVELDPTYCQIILDRMRASFPEIEIKRIDG